MSQRITPKDLERGIVRFPRPVKALFPKQKAIVRIRLRGQLLEASYDPHVGPDRERSAVLRLGVQDLASANEGEWLLVRQEDTGIIGLQ